MALAKTIVPISLGLGGLDTKTDPNQLITGKLTKAENIIYETIGAIRKRNGYDSVNLIDTAGNLIENSRALSKFKNELLLLSSTNLYSFSSVLKQFQNKGSVYSVFPTSTPVIRNAFDHDQVETRFVDNLKITAYHNVSDNSVRYSVVDSAQNMLLVSNALVASSAFQPKMAAIDSTVFIVYGFGTSLRYKTFTTSQPDSLSVEGTLISNLSASDPKFDIAGADRSGEKQIIVAYNSSVPDIRYFGFDPIGNLTTIFSIAGENASGAIDITIDSDFFVVLTWSDTTAVKVRILPFTLSATPLLTTTTVETIADACNVHTITTDTETYNTVYEIDAASNTNHFVKTVGWTFSAPSFSPTILARSVGLASEQFIAEDALYIPVVYQSSLQSTYFILDAQGVVVCKVSPGNGGGLISHGVLPHVSLISDTQALFASQVKSRLDSENGTFFSVLGINSTVLDFDAVEQYQSSSLGDNLHIAGGILQAYDGDAIVEHGFHVYPETITAGATATTGGFISNGNYGYVALYSWIDNYGQEHRSVESAILDVVLSGGTSTQTQEIVVPTLRLTQKENVTIQVYRTENNGTIFYQVTDPQNPLLNNTSVNSVTFTDTVSDTSLISNEVLYTTGGVLENTAAPSAKFIATHTASNRIVLAGLEDPNLVQYSKIRLEGSPVEFNDTLVRPVDPLGGDISGLGIMDEKIIIFKKDAIFYFSGSGPNNLGEQDSFTDIERVSSEIGCLDANSIVLVPQGLMFRSRKGIYLLTRGLGLEYVGAAVEAFNDLTITSSKVVGQFNQVRFTTANGDCLVYNYFLNLWATFTNHAAKSAETINNQYYYLRQDAALYLENPSVFADNGSPIKLKFETGWLSLTALQGFGRVYKLLFLGEFKSSHDLLIKVGYDFNNIYAQEKLISVSHFVTETTYGGDSPYGSGTPYGGEPIIYQARVDMQKQKCESIRFSIEDVQESVGEALSLSALTLQVGAKSGTFKVDSNRKFGTS